MIKNRYATTWWTIDDIREIVPEWTIKQCAKWIDDHEGEIRQRATAAGYTYIINALKKKSI